jgi:(1->4)-alpha-D-glucan 1-alpha-D-glucosylmutase
LSTDREVVDRLRAWLEQRRDDADIGQIQDRAVTQFQQLSAPIAAKSVEDTAFYRYGRLLSRNDVGFDATRFSDSVADFHANMERRRAAFPHGMLATATHDHKRGEDVRARLAALSEYAAEWSDAMARWLARCLPLAPDIKPADIAMLLQMIVGAWPLDLTLDDERGRQALADRLAQWQEKALREAKLVTDWSVPNESYERAARELVTALLARNEHPDLLNEVVAFVERIAPAGAVNGLAQALLKLTAPGIPDIYQGTERWDFSLVDPDNRRPVDFALRGDSLADDIETLAANWRDARIKQQLIARALAVRKKCPELFTRGDYVPLAVKGEHAGRIIAFARRAGAATALMVVPCTASRLLQRGITFELASWVNTSATLPPNVMLIDVYSGLQIDGAAAQISIAKLFRKLPFAFLVSPELGS